MVRNANFGSKFRLLNGYGNETKQGQGEVVGAVIPKLLMSK